MTDTEILVTGCYTPEMNGRGSGLTSWRRSPADGSLTRLQTLALPSPSYVIRHPVLPLAYTANEAGVQGSISVVAIASDGELSEVSRRSSRGALPCHLEVAENGRSLVVANYGTGEALVLNLDRAGLPRGDVRLWPGDAGAAGPRADRQKGSHAHMAVPGPEGHWSVVDLGTDQVRRYQTAMADGAAPERVTALPPGSGPRQLVWGPTGMAYVVGELDSRVHALREREPGVFAVLGSVPSSRTGATPNYPAHMSVTPDGSRLYLSNRGADTIALFHLPSGAAPRFVREFPAGGAWPRHTALVGEHLYVSNERTDTLSVHAIDADTGDLTLAHQYMTGSPTCAVTFGRIESAVASVDHQ